MTAPLGPLACTGGMRCQWNPLATASLQRLRLTPAQPAMAAAPLTDRNWRRVAVRSSAMVVSSRVRASVEARWHGRYRRMDTEHRRMELDASHKIAARSSARV